MTGSVPILISSGVMRQLAESLRGRPKLVGVQIEKASMKQINELELEEHQRQPPLVKPSQQPPRHQLVAKEKTKQTIADLAGSGGGQSQKDPRRHLPSAASCLAEARSGCCNPPA